ncbi:MAG: MarR family transcriptional regulator, partial [Saccharopolyspora sp.]|uniref:MarR family winged helix-turn-helix transcriptional regulator n=1 Tax=Saccharopolyspora sp. TaxID=33915 RepID=UPI002600339E
PMRVMGDRLQLHPTSVTNIVDRLEHDKLVRRVPHPTDRRTTLVEITDDGRDLMKRATESVNEVEFGMVGVTERQTQQLTELLGKVRHAAGDFCGGGFDLVARGSLLSGCAADSTTRTGPDCQVQQRFWVRGAAAAAAQLRVRST